MSALLEKMIDLVGVSNVICGDAVSQRPKNHWDPSPMEAKAIVYPTNTGQVSDILRACHAVGQSVVTQGGVTGLVEGECSTPQDIVLCMTRMNRICAIDVIGKTMTVEAGCVLEQVQSAAEENELQYGVDLGARGSCTIGGNIATNAGGLSVLRYGMSRDQVLGLEVVLADGTVLSSLNRMMKNNAGYDLKQMFVGSEGTLGVITQAVLRLRPATPYVNTAMLAFDDYQQVTRTLGFLSSASGGQLNAFEVLWNRFYRLGTDDGIEGAIRPPLSRDHPLYAIVETRGSSEVSDRQQFENSLESAMERGMFVDAVIPQSTRDRSNIWAVRENVEIVLRHYPRFIYDVSLPIAAMQSYLDQVEDTLKDEWSRVEFYAYGHLADGNLHLIVAPEPENFGRINSVARFDAGSKQHLDWYRQSNQIIYQPLTLLGGSISAEHGIGLEKREYLSLSRNAEEINLMKSLKSMMDPKNILNPGKIVPRPEEQSTNPCG